MRKRLVNHFGFRRCAFFVKGPQPVAVRLPLARARLSAIQNRKKSSCG